MPNGHGGIPRLGSPVLMMLGAVLSVWWFREKPHTVPMILAYGFGCAVAWRLAFHLTMWHVSEYGGHYVSDDEKRTARRRYIPLTVLLILAAVAVVYMVTPRVRAPSLAEHAELVEIVKGRAAQDNASIWPHAPFNIRIWGARATVEYAVKYEPGSQFVFNPIRTELRRVSGKWMVVSHEENRPWWWHVLGHTVGVK